MNLKQATKLLHNVTMHRRRKPLVANNLEAVNAVIEHLHVATCESPALLPILEDAGRDVLQMPTTNHATAQGSPILWCLVLKHIIQALGEMLQQQQTSTGRTTFVKKEYRQASTSLLPKKENQKRLCRNCLSATPSQRTTHTVSQCQQMGNQCNLNCTLCGGKHWESQCSKPAFTA